MLTDHIDVNLIQFLSKLQNRSVRVCELCVHVCVYVCMCVRACECVCKKNTVEAECQKQLVQKCIIEYFSFLSAWYAPYSLFAILEFLCTNLEEIISSYGGFLVKQIWM